MTQNFDDHVVARKLGEILGDLALAESIIERIVDELRGEAV
jgi:hypothetical protein